MQVWVPTVRLRRAGLLAVIWIAGVASMATLFFFLIDVPRLLRLERYSRRTEGRIVAADRRNHMSATIEYFAGGSLVRRSFTGIGDPVGSPTAVYYDPRDPTNASVEEPHRFVGGEIGSAGAACLAFGTWLVLAVVISRLKRQVRSPARNLRMTLAFASLGVAGGFISSLLSNRFHGLGIVEAALMLSGTTLTLVGAFRVPDDYSWRQILTSPMLIGGGLLIIGAVVLQALPL